MQIRVRAIRSGPLSVFFCVSPVRAIGGDTSRPTKKSTNILREGVSGLCVIGGMDLMI